MNADGRKRIDALIKQVETTASARTVINEMIETLNEKINDYREAFADIASAIEDLRDEEQEKFDNMTEGLQQGERGQAIEAAAQCLDSALDYANGAGEIDDIVFVFDTDDIISQLDEAKGL